MKYVKILHYVEKSFGGNPSFIILMDDNNEYISNGCIWKKNVSVIHEELLDYYGCEKELEELLNSSKTYIYDIVDARSMFENSNITKFNDELDCVEKADRMFMNSSLEEFDDVWIDEHSSFLMFHNTKYKRMVDKHNSELFSRYLFDFQDINYKTLTMDGKLSPLAVNRPVIEKDFI